MSSDLSLFVNGREYTAWKTVSYKKSMDSLCSSFTMSLADASKTERKFIQPNRFDIKEGDSAILEVNGKKQLTGFIDSVKIKEPEGREITINGRDRTSDLVDCSVFNIPGSWKKSTFENIANDLLRPFNIKLKKNITVKLSGDKISFDIESGETVFNALDRLARTEDVLLSSTSDGDLLLNSNDNSIIAPVVLKYGGNIKKYDANFNYTNRFSQYIVKAQDAGNGTDSWKKSSNNIFAEVGDNAIDRFRPLIIIAESNANNKSSKRRANWEKVIRIARGTQINVAVQGWEMIPGVLWRIGQLIKVDIDRIGIAQNMLINSIAFNKSDQGSETIISTVPPEAYMREPQKVKKSKESTAWRLI